MSGHLQAPGVQVPPSVIAKVEVQWEDRARALHMECSQKRRRELEVEFFTGAMEAFSQLGYVVPVRWALMISTGRDVVKSPYL